MKVNFLVKKASWHPVFSFRLPSLLLPILSPILMITSRQAPYSTTMTMRLLFQIQMPNGNSLIVGLEGKRLAPSLSCMPLYLFTGAILAI